MLVIARGLDDKTNTLGTQPDGGMRRGYDTALGDDWGGASVLLYARYRGGSTFSSEFFNMHQDVWYLYEPLRHNSFNNREIYMDNATSVPILQKLFSCDLDPLFKLDLPERIQEFLSRHAFCHLPNQNQGCKGLKSKLLLVRYEDLTANATQNLYQIYNFIGLEPDESVSTWAKHATDAVKHQSADLTNEEQERQSGDFGTIRDNPKETALAWRNKIPSDLQAAIDEPCGDYYDIFNYPHNSGKGNYDEKLNMDDIIGR